MYIDVYIKCVYVYNVFNTNLDILQVKVYWKFVVKKGNFHILCFELSE